MSSLICGAGSRGGEAGGNFWTCCRLINQLFLVNPGQTKPFSTVLHPYFTRLIRMESEWYLLSLVRTIAAHDRDCAAEDHLFPANVSISRSSSVVLTDVLNLPRIDFPRAASVRINRPCLNTGSSGSSA